MELVVVRQHELHGRNCPGTGPGSPVREPDVPQGGILHSTNWPKPKTNIGTPCPTLVATGKQAASYGGVFGTTTPFAAGSDSECHCLPGHNGIYPGTSGHTHEYLCVTRYNWVLPGPRGYTGIARYARGRYGLQPSRGATTKARELLKGLEASAKWPRTSRNLANGPAGLCAARRRRNGLRMGLWA